MALEAAPHDYSVLSGHKPHLFFLILMQQAQSCFHKEFEAGRKTIAVVQSQLSSRKWKSSQMLFYCRCGPCPTGMTGSGIGAQGCQEINDCDTDPCDDKALECLDTSAPLRGFTCVCPEGTRGVGVGNSQCLGKPTQACIIFCPDVRRFYKIRVE